MPGIRISIIEESHLLLILLFAAGYAIIAGIVMAVRAKHGYRVRPLRELLRLALLCYVAILLLLTVAPTGYFLDYRASVNLEPLSTITAYARSAMDGTVGMGPILLNVLGNLLLFVPMGMLLPAVWPAFRPAWKCLLFCLACTIAVETAQFVFSSLGMMYRTTDVDDVILNTAGAAAGYGMHRAGRRLFILLGWIKEQ